MHKFVRKISTIISPKGHIFRGWWIAGAGSLAHFIGAVLFVHIFSVYALALEEEFGWSKVALAGAFALSRLEVGLLGPVQGWLIDRYGARSIMRIGLIILGLASLGFSQIDSLLEFYICFFAIALGSSLGGFLSVTVVLVNWFNRHRAKALALSQLGFSFGGLLAPVTILVIGTLGWRATAGWSGIAILFLAWPVTKIIDHRPEDVGETPDGISIDRFEHENPNSTKYSLSGNYGSYSTTIEVLKTKAFWLISIGHATAGTIVGTVIVHIALHLNQQLGFSLGFVGAIITIMTVMQIFGLLGVGFFGDRYNKRIVSAACMVLHAISLLLLAYAENMWMVIAFAVLHGIAMGVRGPLIQAIRADYFGVKNYGVVMGWSLVIVTTGMAIGPVFAGYMADQTGSYVSAFTVMAIIGGLGSILLLLAKKPSLAR